MQEFLQTNHIFQINDIFIDNLRMKIKSQTGHQNIQANPLEMGFRVDCAQCVLGLFV